MKYVIVLGDGMADEPIEAAGGKTPLQLADKPVMDEMAKVSEQGIAYTVPSNLPAGSDVANLSMLGYDPQVYYSGRSPLEALSIGVDMKDTDIALREQQVFSRFSPISSLSKSLRVMPVASYPISLVRNAATELSTPPLIAINALLVIYSSRTDLRS